MSAARERAVAFVEAYGRTWESWDIQGFLDLFRDDVLYVAHATQETVVGKAALDPYIRKEATEQGEVTVRMGKPVVDGDRVAAEFWVTARREDESATIAGGFIAGLAPDGRCSVFREYWFDVEGHAEPYEGWGEQSRLLRREPPPTGPPPSAAGRRFRTLGSRPRAAVDVGRLRLAKWRADRPDLCRLRAMPIRSEAWSPSGPSRHTAGTYRACVRRADESRCRIAHIEASLLLEADDWIKGAAPSGS